MLTKKRVSSYLQQLEQEVDLWQPIKLTFSKKFEKEEDVLTNDLNIRFSKRSRYKDPNFQTIMLFSGDTLIDEATAPFPLIQAFYQKRPLNVKRFNFEKTTIDSGIEVAYQLYIQH